MILIKKEVFPWLMNKCFSVYWRINCKKKPLLTDEIQQNCTILLDERIFIDRCTSPINLSENSNLKVYRSTSVSPQHFQNDKDDTIEYLKASLKEYKQKSQQTIKRLKRKIKQKNLTQILILLWHLYNQN